MSKYPVTGLLQVDIPDGAPSKTTAGLIQLYAAPAPDPVGRQLPNPTQWLPSLLKMDGSELALGSPPLAGSGLLAVRSSYTMIVENHGTVIAKIRTGIGVTRGVQDDKPMNPYLGVGHGMQDSPLAYQAIPPGAAPTITGFRWDVIDPERNPIATWPDWKLTFDPARGAPQLVLCGCNDSPGVDVRYRDVMFELVPFWGMKLRRN